MNKVGNNVLIIVEGQKTEPRFFEKINELYALNFNIHCYNTNIYTLYHKMKELDFCADIKEILLESESDPARRAVLNNKFLYTYLIFDLEIQHREIREKDAPVDDVVARNLSQIEEMAKYFVDETDSTVGRLYINFPMMESYRDCNSFFDLDYMKNFVDVKDIVHYKNIVGNKRNASIRIDRYSKDDFEQLMQMNVFKLNFIQFGNWAEMDYSQYLKCSQTMEILRSEEHYIQEYEKIGVLNTALFLLLDYYGNKNGFYDSVMCIAT